MPFTHQELQAGFRIGDRLVDPRQNRIVRADGEARLEPRVMDVLVCLARSAGEVVSRDTLSQEVWRNLVVTDQAVTNCISELRHHLGDDKAANRVIETIPKRGYRLVAPVTLGDPASHAAPQPPTTAASTAAPAPAPAPPRRRTPPRITIFAALAVVLAGIAIGWWWGASAPALSSVAVVRFENAAGDDTLNYLGLALPDEIATLLTRSRNVAVRPIAYVDAADPVRSAHARGVDHVVTGRFYLEHGEDLTLAIEALHVSQERVIWRTRITAPAGDLLAMRARIAESVHDGLLPALGVTAAGTAEAAPANAEAYQLYLRALAQPQQPNQTERAIEMLERAVALEPTFAPAWHELGLRYYAVGTWFAVDEGARRKSLAAHRKALDLDPDFIAAARSIVNYHAESNDLAGAYAEARKLLDRFGPRSEAHFAISYVYRFGGMFDESQRRCELALERDPQDPRLRSCAYSYLYAGRLNRVMHFLSLDEGSYFVQWGTVLYLLRRDDRAAALNVTRQAADEPTRRLMQPCLEGVRGAPLDAAVAEFVQHWERSGDPEAAYAVAPMLEYCGRPREALRLVERAVDLGFCSFPALDLDSIWKSRRDDPEFVRIRAKGQACHERFRKAVAAYDSANS